jgi:tripartite-type tricarboxylate transporter receptor subunit TctC
LFLPCLNQSAHYNPRLSCDIAVDDGNEHALPAVRVAHSPGFIARQRRKAARSELIVRRSGIGLKVVSFGILPFIFRAIGTPASLAVLIFLAISGGGRGENYPSRPIRVLVGSVPGGAADIGARLAADALGRALGTPVVVEDRAGAGGLNAAEAYLAGEPDGYTILLAAVGSFTIIPAMKRVSYDAEKDFIPLGIVWQSGQVMIVQSASGADSLARFIAHAKARPATLTVGSAGVGTLTHLTLELLKREAAIDVIHIPFRGAGDALPAIIGGQIDALISDVNVIAPHVNAGTVRALAVAAAQRDSALPDVPTMGEAGFPGVIGEIWFGYVVSAKTQPAIVKRLQDALAATRDDPDYRAKLARQRVSAGEPGPDALARLIRTEAVKWRAVVTAAGLQSD